MATYQTNGNPSTASSTNNNGGAFLSPGISTNNAPIATQQNTGFLNTDVSVASGVDTAPALLDATFANNDSRGAIMRATTTLAGESNNTLTSAANNNQKVPTKIQTSTISRFPLIEKTTTSYKYSTKTSTVRTAEGIRQGKFNAQTGQWDAGYPEPAIAYWGTPKLRRVDGPARYFLPTRDEWYKAGFYDPTIGDPDDSLNYWEFATRSNDPPSTVLCDSHGVGLAGPNDNSVMNNNTNWIAGDRTGQFGESDTVLSVGTSGRSSYYGTYDQNGNAGECTEGYGGNNYTDIWRCSFLGAAGNTNTCANYNINYNYKYTATNAGYSNSGFRVASLTNDSNLPNFVVVGNPGNSGNGAICPANGGRELWGGGKGGVSYVYNIGKFQITNVEYLEFLNSVAADDTYGVYRTVMGGGVFTGIQRYGVSGNYGYQINITDFNDKPMTYVTWLCAARYCNWLHNGKPVGPQVAETTEDGAYTLNGETTNGVLRNN